jgi:hypothetical protein
MENLRQIRRALEENAVAIATDENFQFEVQEQIVEQIALPEGTYAMVCSVCEFACHMSCRCALKAGHNDRYRCDAMSWNAIDYLKHIASYIPGINPSMDHIRCTVCRHKCSCSVHRFTNTIMETKTVTVVKTSLEIKTKYEEACAMKLSNLQQIINKIVDEANSREWYTIFLLNGARECLNKLNEIALMPNPMSTIDYIDLLIKEEERSVKPDWQLRVAQYQALRRRKKINMDIAEKRESGIVDSYDAIRQLARQE